MTNFFSHLKKIGQRPKRNRLERVSIWPCCRCCELTWWRTCLKRCANQMTTHTSSFVASRKDLKLLRKSLLAVFIQQHVMWLAAHLALSRKLAKKRRMGHPQRLNFITTHAWFRDWRFYCADCTLRTGHWISFSVQLGFHSSWLPSLSQPNFVRKKRTASNCSFSNKHFKLIKAENEPLQRD